MLVVVSVPRCPFNGWRNARFYAVDTLGTEMQCKESPAVRSKDLQTVLDDACHDNLRALVRSQYGHTQIRCLPERDVSKHLRVLKYAMHAHALRSSTKVLTQRVFSFQTANVYVTRRIMSAKARTAVDETANGEFKRTDAGFRNQVAPGSEFAPEAGRYHLYISYACPWACRALTALHVKGLQDVIGVSVTHPTWQRTRPDNADDTHTGWMFVTPDHEPLSSATGQGSFSCEDCIPDNVNNAKFVRDLYEKSNDTTGKYSVPVLWDKKKGVIVNNESSELLRMFNSAFNDLAKHPEIDLYPEHLRKEIDEVNSWVYPAINNGVYRCGFATKQEPYEQAFRELFSALDRCEELLSQHRYIVGDQLTEADVRLFQTLIRFDEVYVVYFKTNKKFIHEYPNLRGYVQDLYQTPGFAAAVNMRHIKTHYFTSHPALNTYAIIPVGGDPWWEQQHSRYKQFPDAKQAWDK